MCGRGRRSGRRRRSAKEISVDFAAKRADASGAAAVCGRIFFELYDLARAGCVDSAVLRASGSCSVRVGALSGMARFQREIRVERKRFANILECALGIAGRRAGRIGNLRIDIPDWALGGRSGKGKMASSELGTAAVRAGISAGGNAAHWISEI